MDNLRIPGSQLGNQSCNPGKVVNKVKAVSAVVNRQASQPDNQDKVVSAAVNQRASQPDSRVKAVNQVKVANAVVNRQASQPDSPAKAVNQDKVVSAVVSQRVNQLVDSRVKEFSRSSLAVAFRRDDRPDNPSFSPGKVDNKARAVSVAANPTVVSQTEVNRLLVSPEVIREIVNGIAGPSLRRCR